VTEDMTLVEILLHQTRLGKKEISDQQSGVEILCHGYLSRNLYQRST